MRTSVLNTLLIQILFHNSKECCFAIQQYWVCKDQGIPFKKLRIVMRDSLSKCFCSYILTEELAHYLCFS